MKRTRYRIDESRIIDEKVFKTYLYGIVHEWSKTVTILAISLVPIFIILDFFAAPESALPKFAVYRSVGTLITIMQYFILKRTSPGKLSYIHGYLVSIFIGGAIVLMTVDLGGFDSRYYAGLNLVIIGVNLLLPWEAKHSAANSLIIVVFYVGMNFMAGNTFDTSNFLGNMFFMNATIVIAVSITHVRHKMIKQEFFLRNELKNARDALWGEMAIAKKIQKSLLPEVDRIGSYQIAAKMIPALEIGGDYYDIIRTKKNENWVAIGDVSGHGVESGLIMMMTQTSIFSLINNTPNYSPSTVLNYANTVLKNNISRLGSNYYMTIVAIKLEEESIKVSGKHQDIYIYRSEADRIDVIPTEGTWIGLVDDIGGYLQDTNINIGVGDIILLFTDGITESLNYEGELYGDQRLLQSFMKYKDLNVGAIVDNMINDVTSFLDRQEDDITLLAIKKIF